MDFFDLLSVVASKIETFFASISYLDTLYLVAMFMGVTLLLLVGYTLISRKAVTSRCARRMSRYFENVYIGSSYEAGKFLRKKRHLMNRRARERFTVFMRSSVPITHTGFTEAVLDKGRHSLTLVSNTHYVFLIIAETFVLIKGMLGGLHGMVLFLYAVVPFVIMLLLHFVVYLAVRHVNKMYVRNSKRLERAVLSIDFNMVDRSYGESEVFRKAVHNLSHDRAKAIDDMATKLEQTDTTGDIGQSAIIEEDNLCTLKGCIEGTISNI